MTAFSFHWQYRWSLNGGDVLDCPSHILNLQCVNTAHYNTELWYDYQTYGGIYNSCGITQPANKLWPGILPGQALTRSYAKASLPIEQSISSHKVGSAQLVRWGQLHCTFLHYHPYSYYKHSQQLFSQQWYDLYLDLWVGLGYQRRSEDSSMYRHHHLHVWWVKWYVKW